MKRLIALALCAACILCLAACAAKDAGETPPEAQTEPEAQIEPIPDVERRKPAAEPEAEPEAEPDEEPAEEPESKLAEAEEPAEAPAEETAPAEEPAEAPAPLSPEETEALVETIRAQYQSIVSDSALEAHTYGDAATVYTLDGGIVSVAEYAQLSDAAAPELQTAHYYYQDGVPFFVFIEYENSSKAALRLYFHDGALIRWIEGDGAPVDHAPRDDLAAYYEEACNALQRASEVLAAS